MARMAKAQAKTSETKVTEVKADVTAVVRKARAPSPVVRQFTLCEAALMYEYMLLKAFCLMLIR